jgi:hypothetical protein
MFTPTLKKKVIFALTLVTAPRLRGKHRTLHGHSATLHYRTEPRRTRKPDGAIAKVIGDAGLDAFRTDLAKWKAIFRGRITIIDDGGKVILDSDAKPRDARKPP